jgi:hypothetical protein
VCACHQNMTNPHLFFFGRTTEGVDPFCHRSVWFGNGEEHGQLVISLPTVFRNHTTLMYRTGRKDTKISSFRILMSLKSSYLMRLNSVISLSPYVSNVSDIFRFVTDAFKKEEVEYRGELHVLRYFLVFLVNGQYVCSSI